MDDSVNMTAVFFNRNFSFIIFSLLIGWSCEKQPDSISASNLDQVEANKEIVHSFYKQVIGQQDEVLADQLLREDYIQHNPFVKTGKAGFFETLAYLKQMPKPENPVNPIVRSIGDGNFVALHLSLEIAGSKKVVIDLFRLEDGKLAEHWDVIEDHPEETANGNTMTDGVVEIENTEASDSKEKAIDFYQTIWIEQDVDKLQAFVHTDLIQHAPEITNGLEGLRAYLGDDQRNVSINKVHRVIGEGNFVVAQLEGEIDDVPFAICDIMRFSDGKIIEQWRAKQAIPDTMVHGNGMF